MMQEHEIIEQIKERFEQNYQSMKLESGHAMTEDIKQLALNQVLFYYQKMRDVATRVTDTEVKLTLPNQATPNGRIFTIEGVVDIIREDEEIWMYDIKTHDPEYIASNKEFYQKQLNVYAHIWQELRGEALDHTAVISTAYPKTLKHAIMAGDLFRIQHEVAKWQPLIDLPFKKEDVQEVIDDFATIVDRIEDKNFIPAPIEKLNTKFEGTNVNFGTRVCRNCDARFSCSSYREFISEPGRGLRASMKKYFDDFGDDADKEEWIHANLQNDNIRLE